VIVVDHSWPFVDDIHSFLTVHWSWYYIIWNLLFCIVPFVLLLHLVFVILFGKNFMILCIFIVILLLLIIGITLLFILVIVDILLLLFCKFCSIWYSIVPFDVVIYWWWHCCYLFHLNVVQLLLFLHGNGCWFVVFQLLPIWQPLLVQLLAQPFSLAPAVNLWL